MATATATAKIAERFSPRYTLTPSMVRYLMEIEACRQLVDAFPLDEGVQSVLRRDARINAAHFSTKIEANPLSLKEVSEIEQKHDHSRSAEAQEVRNYLRALEYIHDKAGNVKLDVDLLKRLHALIEVRRFPGRRPTLSAFRSAQNSVTDDRTGALEYLPPEPNDVPWLCDALMIWLNGSAREVPGPVVAAIAQYQLVTIHPWMDGNGRTSRAFGTLLLRRSGYDLKGFFSIEEQFDRDLTGYYGALQNDLHHNYYFGRNKADLTRWLTFFLRNMTIVFRAVKDEVLSRASAAGAGVKRDVSYERARRSMHRQTFTLKDIVGKLNVADRTARKYVRRWVDSGKAEVVDFSKKKRNYRFLN